MVPLVSVIVPAFNAEQFIRKTLDSILAQTYERVEIIVVDDGSTDQTATTVAQYGSVVKYYCQPNGGAGPARNTGIIHSSGDFLCFIDADDLMPADRIARQLDFMTRYPQVDLVFCNYRNFSEGTYFAESHFQTCPLLWHQLENREELVLQNSCAVLAQENFGIAGTLLLRRRILQLEAGFDPTVRLCEDFHFYYRLARHSPVGILKEVGMLRRLHHSNSTNNTAQMLRDGIRSYSLLRATERDPSICKSLDRHIVECQMSLARHYADNGQFLDALIEDCKMLPRHLHWHQVWITCRNIARTIVMALGFHRVT